jgi:hypothetical protein
MSDDEEYKKRRERNNISVQMCRQKEKEKVEKAKNEVEQYKQENKTLKEKYDSLERELKMLKSLFNNQSSNETTSISINTNDNLSLQSLLQPHEPITHEKQIVETQNNNSKKQDSANHEISANLKTIKKQTTKRRESTSNKLKNEVLLKEIKKSSSTSSLSQLLNSDRKPSLGNDLNFQNQQEQARKETTSETSIREPIFYLIKEQEHQQATTVTTQTQSINSATSIIPMPFHHEYAISLKNPSKKN